MHHDETDGPAKPFVPSGGGAEETPPAEPAPKPTGPVMELIQLANIPYDPDHESEVGRHVDFALTREQTIALNKVLAALQRMGQRVGARQLVVNTIPDVIRVLADRIVNEIAEAE